MSENIKDRYTFQYNVRNFYNDIFVDIVIPFRDGNAQLVDLINSIFEKVKRPGVEIYLVDDGSNNKAFLNNFAKISSVHLIQFDKPVGFGAAVNAGISQCKNSTVCIMHSDTKVIEPNFLYNLCKDMIKLKDQNVASISAITNNPMSKKLDVLKRSKSEDIDPELLNNVNSPFFCTLINKQIFELCKGFPEYPLCWYEQELLGDKLKKAGFKQAYSNRSYIYHAGGATITRLVNQNKKNMEVLKNNYVRYEKDRAPFIRMS